MVAFDVAVGVSQAIVNTLLPVLFGVLRPTGIFTINYPINEVGFKGVEVVLTQAPVVNFTSPGLPEHLVQSVTMAIQGSPMLNNVDNATRNAVVSGALTAISDAGFDVMISNINVTLSFVERGAHNISLISELDLTPVVSINASSPPNIQLQIAAGLITTNDAELDDILNESIIPYLRDDLNSFFINGFNFSVPPLDAIQVAVPVIEVADDYLLAFTAIGTTQPDVPSSPQNWPSDGVFVLVSPDGLAQAGDLEIAKHTAILHKSFSEGPFSGDAGIWLDPLQDISVFNDGTLTVEATAHAGCSVSINFGWPFGRFSFGPTVDGTIGIEAKPSVKNGNLIISEFLPTAFDLSVSFGGFPSWVESLIDGLLDPLRDAILHDVVEPLFQDLFGNLEITLMKIPEINITAPGNLTVSIDFDTVNTSGITIDGRRLLAAVAIPTIS